MNEQLRASINKPSSGPVGVWGGFLEEVALELRLEGRRAVQKQE